MTKLSYVLLVVSCFVLLVLVENSYSQATRTWVSGVGDDVNPCSRTAPCKTFAGAISKTATGGEINCLDPAGYGAVTITKPITIDCTGTFGSILASQVNGIIINLANSPEIPPKIVRLRGLTINGAGSGLSGIRVISAARVIIENTVLDGFTQNGITIQNTGQCQVTVDGVSARNNTGSGIFAQTDGSADVVVTRSLIAGNGVGISSGSGASVIIQGNTIVQNLNGLFVSGSGKIISAKDNLIDSNRTNGAPTSTSPLQ
jgi:hypothetical protein